MDVNKKKKSLWLFSPIQLFNQMQWWSIFLTQQLQILQCLDLLTLSVFFVFVKY